MPDTTFNAPGALPEANPTLPSVPFTQANEDPGAVDPGNLPASINTDGVPNTSPAIANPIGQGIANGVQATLGTNVDLSGPAFGKFTKFTANLAPSVLRMP